MRSDLQALRDRAVSRIALLGFARRRPWGFPEREGFECFGAGEIGTAELLQLCRADMLTVTDLDESARRLLPAGGGLLWRTSSTSNDAMSSPSEMSKSSERPVIRLSPSGFRTARLPVWNQPSDQSSNPFLFAKTYDSLKLEAQAPQPHAWSSSR